MTIALRVYAIAERNRLVGGALSVLIIAQLCFGIWAIVMAAIFPIQSVPEINLDAYRICFFKRWRFGELSFTITTVAFDLAAFLVILVTARGVRTSRYPGIPSILGVVLRDATVYFMLMFACQLVLLLFLFLAPVQIQLTPGVAQTTLLPIMASRLMLSLKKVATEPKGSWSLSTMTNPGWRVSSDLRFVSQTFGMPHETPETPASPNEEDVELESMARLPRNRGSQ
ncbi:hypothetical protein BDM02DRAFT_1545403 [Thelephora ganbajun]|uniref:Uncharacterized protein n=1 Tax=Thelephora ganbajun TaxID=370292 RepID=A0ACB6Z121_THEGA|nr:hypothetical protein BDM02DRAFT_1545403 [Thelephora ganbajun]